MSELPTLRETLKARNDARRDKEDRAARDRVRSLASAGAPPPLPSVMDEPDERTPSPAREAVTGTPERPPRATPRNGTQKPAAAGFGSVLREVRVRAGLSQYQLAAVVDCDHSTIARLESGVRTPIYAMTDRLATALSLSPADRHRLFVAAGFAATEIIPAIDAAVMARYAELVEAAQTLCTNAVYPPGFATPARWHITPGDLIALRAALDALGTAPADGGEGERS